MPELTNCHVAPPVVKPYWVSDCKTAAVYLGKCEDVMPTLAAESVYSVVSDPPYGLSFMGKEWDHGVPGASFWKHAMRLCRPGAHLLAFGGTRTFHRLACAVEDAGWDIRDVIAWVYGSGFPKSLDVSKAIDKEAKVVREPDDYTGANYKNKVYGSGMGGGRTLSRGDPATAAAAAAWEGWGTALKPSFEPIVVARKPLIGTVSANVQEYETGAINVDGCRIGVETVGWNGGNGFQNTHEASKHGGLGAGAPRPVQGRWPANFVHDGSDEVVKLFPDAGGGSASDYDWRESNNDNTTNVIKNIKSGVHYGDSGNAARFFYCAKPAPEERGDLNKHPTQKPVDLMQWLVRLVTRRGGLVLDPFMGSGTTGVAAINEGMRFVGIEQDETYCKVAVGRIQHAMMERGLMRRPQVDNDFEVM